MTTIVDTEQQTPTGPVADAVKTQEQRFKWRSWVHYPEGASQCEHATDGKCRDEEHFHALCRLPNPYQVRDITEKASAARARRLRMLRDPDSDPRVILEEELARLYTVPKDILVDELIDRNFSEDYSRALTEVEAIEVEDYTPEGDDEDGQVPKLYANIDQDREEYLRQRELPEEKREDDYAELEATYERYSRDVQEAMERVQKPARDHLLSLDIAELVDQVRKERIVQQGTEAYLHTYMTWQMFACTYKGTAKGMPNERAWTSVEQMKFAEESPVILLVKQAFEDLENQLARNRLGKDS